MTRAASGAASPPEVFEAAIGAAQDLSGLCSRQPETCRTAQDLMQSLTVRAKYSIRLLYEWANSDLPQSERAGPSVTHNRADAMTTNSQGMRLASSETDQSQSTLRLDDLIPEWRGPPTQS